MSPGECEREKEKKEEEGKGGREAIKERRERGTEGNGETVSGKEGGREEKDVPW